MERSLGVGTRRGGRGGGVMVNGRNMTWRSDGEVQLEGAKFSVHLNGSSDVGNCTHDILSWSRYQRSCQFISKHPVSTN